jgi:small-conductance mechanosensitive channel
MECRRRARGTIEDGVSAQLDAAVEIGKTLGRANAWIVGAFWVARVASDRVRRAMLGRSVAWSGTLLVKRLVSITIRVIGIMFALAALGVSGTGPLAVASAFTVAIGLSPQDVMKNFFAGIYLLMERPLKAGDRTVVKDVGGEVQGIDIRTTMRRNTRNELVLIPNATVFTEVIRNVPCSTVRRLERTIRSAGRSLQEVEASLRAAVEASDEFRKPVPPLRIVSRDETGLTLVLAPMVENTDEARNAAAQLVIDARPGETIEVSAS